MPEQSRLAPFHWPFPDRSLALAQDALPPFPAGGVFLRIHPSQTTATIRMPGKRRKSDLPHAHADRPASLHHTQRPDPLPHSVATIRGSRISSQTLHLDFKFRHKKPTRDAFAERASSDSTSLWCTHKGATERPACPSELLFVQRNDLVKRKRGRSTRQGPSDVAQARADHVLAWLAPSAHHV